MQLTRREFLKLMLAGSASLVLSPLANNLANVNVWAASTAASAPKRKRLVVVFLRGAADGLNVLVPYSDPNYYRLRPNIAIAKAGTTGGALNLDGQFGMHPALMPLQKYWQNKTLAFVQGYGSPDPSRSHFDAQDFMESGTPGRKTTPDGWMTRLVKQLPGQHSSTFATSFSSNIPRIFSGGAPVATVSTGKRDQQNLPVDRPGVQAVFDQLYDGTDALSAAYQDAMSARSSIKESLASADTKEQIAANNGAPLANGFADTGRKIGTLLGKDQGMQVVFVDIGGWDTHINQGSTQGTLANNLKNLGAGLDAMISAMGPEVYKDTTILVTSEFGRTVKENGNKGTDHGHGSMLMVLGGNVNGGKRYGHWSGLEAASLNESRDLAVTDDFRNVIGGLLQRSFGLSEAQIAGIFPGKTGSSAGYGGILRG